ncbi:MAG: adenylate kinase [Alphaproteobacteria bacterium]
MNRIFIIGTSCSGKTSLAKILSQKLNIETYDLDEYIWLKNWQLQNREEYEKIVKTILNEPQWIISGNSSFVREKADTLIWLDYSFKTIFWRAIKRCLKRIIKKESCCNNNIETFRRTFFSQDSILLWIIKTYKKRKKEYIELFATTNNKICLRFSNPNETQIWFDKLNK